MSIRPMSYAFVLAVLAAVIPTTAVGEDFRMENKVFAGADKKPNSQGTTIFFSGVVFDYLEQPSEVVVFDKAAGKFTLLDTGRQVQAEVTTEQIESFTAGLKQRAAAHQNPVIRALADPSFQEQFEAKSGELTLVSPQVTYTAKLTTPSRPAIAEQYREFSDWYIRMNALLAPGSLPPFARMVLNQTMAKHQATPSEVELSLKMGAKRVKMRSEHELVPQLNAADVARITQTQADMRSFKSVEFEDYKKGK